jgi:predicted HicB family RNase H-like nuclease
MMEYKGYIGKVEFDDEASLFHGEVINTRDVITFQGKSVAELKKAFRGSVDDYLAFCAERGEEPDRPYSGQFVTRVSPELHRQATIAASRAGKSLNAWVSEQLQAAVDNRQSATTVRRQRSGSTAKTTTKRSRTETR